MSNNIERSNQHRLVARHPLQTTRATDSCYCTFSPYLSRSSSYSRHSPDHPYNALHSPLSMCNQRRAQRLAQYNQRHGRYHQCTALNVTLHAPLPPLASPVSLLSQLQMLVIIRTPHLQTYPHHHRHTLTATSSQSGCIITRQRSHRHTRPCGLDHLDSCIPGPYSLA